jgi:hypothetical protein
VFGEKFVKHEKGDDITPIEGSLKNTNKLSILKVSMREIKRHTLGE